MTQDASTPGFSHIDETGAARMVDVGAKTPTRREALVRATVRMDADTRRRIESGDTPKGAVLDVARIAGIQGAKRTAELIPLCHPLPIETVDIDFAWQKENADDTDAARLLIVARAVVTAKTGVEMEAMTAASVAALTVYDMCKAVDRSMAVESIELLEKRGGRSGHWTRDDA